MEDQKLTNDLKMISLVKEKLHWTKTGKEDLIQYYENLVKTITVEERD